MIFIQEEIYNLIKCGFYNRIFTDELMMMWLCCRCLCFSLNPLPDASCARVCLRHCTT